MAWRSDPHIADAPSFRSPRAETSHSPSHTPQSVRLNANENPLGASPRAVEAIRQAASDIHLYPPLGDRSLRSRLAETLSRRDLGIDLSDEQFVTAHGATEVIAMVCSAFLSPGDEAIHAPPTYPVFAQMAQRRGAVLRAVPRKENSLRCDVEAIVRTVGAKTSLVYVANPNNPTGDVLSADEMEFLLSETPASTLVISDECYHHYVDADSSSRSLELLVRHPNLILLHSFSKAFGLAGLRCGYAVASADVADYLARTRGPYHLGSLELAGALAALEDREHLAETVALVRAGRKQLFDGLKALGADVWPSAANFLLFRPPPGILSARATASALADDGIHVRELASFGLPDHLRVTVGLEDDNRRFLDGLAAHLEASSHARA